MAGMKRVVANLKNTGKKLTQGKRDIPLAVYEKKMQDLGGRLIG